VGSPDQQSIAGGKIFDFVGAFIDEKRSYPAEGWASTLIQAKEADGTPALTREEVVNISFFLFLAGLDTVLKFDVSFVALSCGLSRGAAEACGQFRRHSQRRGGNASIQRDQQMRERAAIHYGMRVAKEDFVKAFFAHRMASPQ
jgi:hypothetical protein